MRWEWDSSGDNRVASLWILREELSRSRKVVYSKWYSGRATFFSRELFTALYRISRESRPQTWRRESGEILDILTMDSPLSTKQVKQFAGLQGRLLERVFEQSMKPLWQHFDIVGFGEVPDSSFASLAIGATKTLFEDLVHEASTMSLEQAQAITTQFFPEDAVWTKFWRKTQKLSTSFTDEDKEL
jgi:hypothetical protein